MFMYLSLTCLNEEPSDPLLTEKLPPQTLGNLVKKIRLATNYAFWCTNTTMWNSRSKLISTPFPHIRENSSKFRLSGPMTAVTHNKSFSDCFSVKIYLHHYFTTDPTRSKYNHIEIIRKVILRHFGYYQWHISKGSWLVIFLLSNQIEV